MNFSAPFVRRPIATTLLSVALALLGVVAYLRLPIASLPLLERPVITVFATLPGASSDTVASSVSAPLEHQLGLISGIKEMRARSINGTCTITLEFGLEKDLDEAAGAVQAAINAAAPWLPKNMPQPPTYAKANANGFPVMALALTSDAYDLPAIFEYADTVVAQRVSQIDGVAAVFIGGGGRPAVRIEANPRSIADMGLSLEKVRAAVSAATADKPKGEITDGAHAISLAANDQLYKASDYRDVVVGMKNGAPIKLRDVADVNDSVINLDRAAWFNGEPALVMSVIKTPDANVVKTVDDILAVMPQLKRWIPPAIKVHVVYDRTLLIRAAISDVQFTMMVALILVVLVIALFLRRLWATVIPVVSIPLSIAATLVAMYFLDFSIDNISLMALTIAIGFVIDDAVIIIENITRLIQEGEHADRCRPEGNAADGLYRRLDHLGADCRSRPGPVHARHCRPSVSRIGHHPGRGHCGFGHHLIDPDANDVRPASRPARTNRAGPHQPLLRTRDRPGGRLVCREPRLGTALPLGHAARRGRADRGDDCVVRKLTQRFFADPGHRHFADQDRDTLQHVVRGYGGITAIGRFADRGGPSCGKRFLGDRSWGHERRHDADKSKAAERS